jgi:hypothetical protein
MRVLHYYLPYVLCALYTTAGAVKLFVSIIIVTLVVCRVYSVCTYVLYSYSACAWVLTKGSILVVGGGWWVVAPMIVYILAVLLYCIYGILHTYIPTTGVLPTTARVVYSMYILYYYHNRRFSAAIVVLYVL